MVWTEVFFAFGKFFGNHLMNLLALIDFQWAVIHLMMAVVAFITIKWSVMFLKIRRGCRGQR
ncbi:hypothetical protein PM3016_2788 [Paenibacillus mucilaginosus 3016]|uniref:Uncharacterized protein n=2 Tax=Paenibacillus mucilaginosus TaxID=61624 RepID=H6NJI4_9BACL|nr:hypothetical protein KNP414_02531 [Paenibacillus mucilaginosus KNP414]AFC29664.1 hypothetical protein PM3016_2788 [Paenibacillus mucilaginosus 3016]WFA18343.1 hypothetical protein ERY13_14220 [Paenibacillus mucilaginosus]